MTNWLEEFILERRYLKTYPENRTILQRFLERVRYTGTDQLSKKALVSWVVAMRKAGVKPVSCNTFISGINAFCNWLYKNEYVEARFKVEKLKTEQTVFQPVR